MLHTIKDKDLKAWDDFIIHELAQMTMHNEIMFHHSIYILFPFGTYFLGVM